MTLSVARAAAAALGCLVVVVSHSPVFAATNCLAPVKAADGTVRVSARNVGTNFRWGTKPGAENSAFANAGTCISGTPPRARNCLLGAAGTLAARTPPASCWIYLKDDTATCSVLVRGCTPGLRLRDGSFPGSDPRLEGLSLELVGGQPTLRFTGVNVQVVSGSGTTSGTVNGLGNLIIGYNGNTIGAAPAEINAPFVGESITRVVMVEMPALVASKL
jgi:hypothetical protein